MGCVELPMSSGAAEKLRAAQDLWASSQRGLPENLKRGFDQEHINAVAGYDADAKFAEARSRLGVSSDKPVHHRFLRRGGKIVHEFMVV